MAPPRPYEPISDWSVKGRARLVQDRKDEIALLLEEAFLTFLDDALESLERYGFNSPDPLSEAVDFALHRFATGDLDPRKLWPGDRTFRLFTRPDFWLAQKVGHLAHQRLRAELQSTPLDAESEVAGEAADLEEARNRFIDELAQTLRLLRRKTCSDLVGYWLLGSERLRRDWFNWTVTTPRFEHHRSSARSLYQADALFRFLVLFGSLLDHEPTSLPTRTVVARLFSPCENSPPYSRRSQEVFAELGLAGSRQVKVPFEEGMEQLLEQALQLAATRTLRGRLAEASLRSSLFDHHDLTLPDLHARVRRGILEEEL